MKTHDRYTKGCMLPHHSIIKICTSKKKKKEEGPQIFGTYVILFKNFNISFILFTKQYHLLHSYED